MRRPSRERLDRIKQRLYDKIKSVYTLSELAEWAWEDFGVKIKSWSDFEKLVMRDEVTLGDLITLLLEAEVELTEEDLGLTDEDLRDISG